VQSALLLTSPGVPDLYNGVELWDFSMVDPDNRAPVDFALRERLLEEVHTGLREDRTGSMRHWFAAWQDGRIKLALTHTLLQARVERAELFATGDYQPVTVSGAQAEEICAFARTREGQGLICAVARFPHRRAQRGFDADLRLTPPASVAGGAWRELLTGREFAPAAEGFSATELFDLLPVAVLVPASAAVRSAATAATPGAG
jgi:(1->4)-alpha-D-glucan 1-alpha-D-glucosylmutase